MQLNLTTDYAIRLLLYLGNSNRTLPGPRVAEAIKISPKYLMKISSQLRGAGLLGSLQGAQGGYYLRKPLDKITLLEVIETMEPSSKWNRCLDEDAFCNRGIAADCPIRKYYMWMQKDMEEKWLSRTLEEIQEMTGTGPAPVDYKTHNIS